MTPKHRALIVDGDAHSLIVASSMLDALDIEYKRSTNAAKAVEQALKSMPDFILLNLDLPEADPFLVSEALRAALDNVPVIAMVKDELAAQLLPHIQAGSFAGYITKPLIQKELQTLLKDLLQ